MRDLFDDFLEDLRRREAAARGEDPDAGGPRRPKNVGPDRDDDGPTPDDGPPREPSPPRRPRAVADRDGGGGGRHLGWWLVGGSEDAPLRVALVTTHLALAQVPAAITFDAVNETLRIVDASLRSQFGIVPPRIGVCGLNPHAGEGGHLGREEIDTIAPAIAACVRDGLDVHGPIPADTAFVPRHASGFHAIVAMFHDQGLPVLKAASFGGGVNVTLGLPFVRTSVDHGTALDLAADAQLAAGADAGSLVAAVELAISMARSGRPV